MCFLDNEVFLICSWHHYLIDWTENDVQPKAQGSQIKLKGLLQGSQKLKGLLQPRGLCVGDRRQGHDKCPVLSAHNDPSNVYESIIGPPLLKILTNMIYLISWYWTLNRWTNQQVLFWQCRVLLWCLDECPGPGGQLIPAPALGRDGGVEWTLDTVRLRGDTWVGDTGPVGGTPSLN